MSDNLELRMYGLVPYNISPIQQAIQFGHAVVEYGQKMKKLGDNSLNTQYDEWADRWKTFIILNGGTTNHRENVENGLPFGSLNNHVLTLIQNDVSFATFNEPDLGDQLTAVVFIVDERVFNRKKYPDFGDWVMQNHFSYLSNNMLTDRKIEKMRKEGYFLTGNKDEKKLYSDWVNFVGGEKNVFLRDFLSKVKLA